MAVPAALLAAQDRPKRRKAEQMLAAAVQSMTLLLQNGAAGLDQLTQDEQATLEKDLGKAPGGWDSTHFKRLPLSSAWLNNYSALTSPTFKT